MDETRPRKSWLPRVLLFLVLLLVGAEVAVRVDDWRAGRTADFYLPPRLFEDGMYKSHPFTGITLKPNFKREGGQYSFSINALGMRSAEMSAKKPPGVYRIFCLGGSTTYGTGATSNDKTYPAQMERLLNKLAQEGHAPPGRRYEVGNCGVSGWSSVENLINLELKLVEFEPDAILVYDAVNDGRMIQAKGFVPDYSHLRISLSVVTLSPFERFLLGHVRLYARLTRGTEPDSQSGKLANYLFVPNADDLAIPSKDWINEDGLRVLQRNEASMIGVARQHGIQPVLSTMAVRDPTSNYLGAYMVRANQSLRELAKQDDVPLIDVDKELSNQPELYDDWVHFNDKGEQRHAQVVVERALKLGLFGLH